MTQQMFCFQCEQTAGCKACTGAVQKEKFVPKSFDFAANSGRTDDYDMEELWNAHEDIRSLKSLILFGIRGVAAYAYHAAVLGYTGEEVSCFFYKANTETYGNPIPTEVSLPIEKGLHASYWESPCIRRLSNRYAFYRYQWR